jgi:MFS family permease
VTHPQPSAEAPPAAAPRPGAFAALQRASFRWLLLGTTLSNGAQWIQQVTLSWLVYELTGSGTMLGSINLVRSVATLGLATFAGVIIDRVARRSLMFAVNSWLFVISLALGLSLLAGYTALWPLFVFTFLGGIAQAIDLPLRQTVVFVLVPRAVASSAVALVQTGWALMRSLGPAVGGLLILWLGPGGNFVVQAAAYALITLTTLQMRFPAEPSTPKGTPMGGAFREGLQYVLTERRTRAFLLMGWVLPLFIVPIYSALPPIYAKDVFAGGPAVLGALLSAVGIGGVAGGFFSAALSKVERRGLLQLGALLLLSLSLIGFAFSPNLLVALPLLAISGFFEMIYITTSQTLLQLSIPDELRGRVTGIITLSAGLIPVGSLAAGVGADLIGPRAITIALAGAALLIALIVAWASPTIRDYRMSEALAPGG